MSLPRPFVTGNDHAEVVRRLHARLAARGLDLPLRLWDGSTLGPHGETFRLVIHDPSVVRSLFPPSDRAAGEAFVSGGLDVEGSLIDALKFVSSLNVDGGLKIASSLAMLRDLWSLPTRPEVPATELRRARLRGRVHSPQRDAAAIRHHYDVGNEFYRLLLDENLVYSCAIFDDDDAAAPMEQREALDRAQVRKLDTICQKLHLQPGERMLDIGCGWGALVMHAARHFGVEAIGITLSPLQAELARQRIEVAGLADRVEIRVADYREVHETFDAIASVGMVEHVGQNMLETYVDTLVARLRSGGRVLNHGITTGRRAQVRDLSRDRSSFVGTYVFPDGALVPVHEMVRLLHGGGLEIRDVEQLRSHYALTLRHWLANLEGSWESAVDLVGVETARVWRAYMAGSIVGFESGDLGIVQILATKGAANLPFGRRWMLPVRP